VDSVSAGARQEVGTKLWAARWKTYSGLLCCRASLVRGAVAAACAIARYRADAAGVRNTTDREQTAERVRGAGEPVRAERGHAVGEKGRVTEMPGGPLTEGDWDGLYDYLSHSIVTPEARNELLGYLEEAFHRFLITLGLVPRRGGRLLEIGANPYFLTLLLKKFRAYELSLTNYFDGASPKAVQTIVNERYGETHEMEYWQVNVERDEFPFEDGAFQVVLFCEVLEHLLEDPMHALLEIHRTLAPGGYLVMSTPNVARWANIQRMLVGEVSIYDPYSRYGPYGRHNREYTLAELTRLLPDAGFRVRKAFTADVHDSEPIRHALARHRIPAHGEHGEYCFVAAQRGDSVGRRRPAWIYR
jgi:SAM-dependent methyltransferase